MVGLPLHLWTNEIFKRIGDNCGDFLALEKEIDLTTMLWAHILVRLEGKERPYVLNVETVLRIYKL